MLTYIFRAQIRLRDGCGRDEAHGKEWWSGGAGKGKRKRCRTRDRRESWSVSKFVVRWGGVLDF